ncbi:MAG TPA: 6-carboxytetrahydropterin synthase [Gemmatimonadales bacterium]|nr:6-carboxytetrahydropterin synthase [Gemmatimonadales bacterium]
MPRCAVTRRVHFNAAHRLFNPALSDAENEAIFGVCSNPNYHGHNYELDVTVEGEIDPTTGYVIDMNRLKALVDEKLLRHLDHKNLNLDVPWFRDRIPTAENIAVVCWEVLAPAIPAGRLLRLRLWETPRNYVEYEGR